MTAERGASKPNTLENRSVKRSQYVQEANTSYQEDLKDIHAKHVQLREAISRLTGLLKEREKMVAGMKAEILIKVIGKERIGNKGRQTWPMYI